ncbi:MAG: hypothetical protein J2P46_02945 [Zavarzinella sp.]|nr:hypothetical protein [Zavarzinella sp.]
MKKTVLRVQECEDRLAPSAAIASSYEAYSWVLINTLRANPGAFADNLQGLANGTVSSAFGFSKSDPVVADLKALVNRATHPGNYAASLALMRATPAAGPLAWDDQLAFQAGLHNNWMKANGFAHTGSTGHRAAIPGFTKNDAAPSDTWGYGPGTYASVGEDIAWAVGSARNAKAAYNTGSITLTGLYQREAFLDTAAYVLELNSNSLGHLQALLGRDDGMAGALPAFNSIGIDENLFQAPPAYEAQDGVPEAWVSTHRLALYRPNGSGGYIAGVAYQDKNGNGFYDAGEGLGVTVDIRDLAGNGTTVGTDDQGAYSEYLPNGDYTVTFTAGGQWLGSRTVHVNNTNDWADLAVSPASASSTATPSVTATPSFTLSAAPVSVTAARPAPEPPVDLGRPTIMGPSGALDYLRPTVTWTGVDGASGYQVRVDDLTAGTTNLFPGGTVSKEDWTVPDDLVSGRSYRVWVRAVRGDTVGPWGAPSDFSIDRPTPIGPDNGVTDVRPTFTWSPIAGASGYEIRVNDSTANVPGIFQALVGDTAWAPSADLVSGRTYTWQVRAVNASGRGAWSAPATVTLGWSYPTGPAGDMSYRRPTLTWSGFVAAPAYQVRLDDLTTGQNAIYLATTGSLDWTPPQDLSPGHTYRYSARALNSNGLGLWGPGQTFRIV